ncbi:hypothetical protein NXU94_24425 [Bacteroides faecis]|uniref:hypothetical protein n=1 Tax=Bacteroides faecis TaxID=674529 RepID=UPI002166AD6D|nr:hypothetical protein [Bacteroides faecis]MCS3070116.1 hypothetical protein [Bacteroides faecis]
MYRKIYNGLYTATANGSGQANSPLAAIYESGYKVTRITESAQTFHLFFAVQCPLDNRTEPEGKRIFTPGYVTSHNKNWDATLLYRDDNNATSTNITELKLCQYIRPAQQCH